MLQEIVWTKPAQENAASISKNVHQFGGSRAASTWKKRLTAQIDLIQRFPFIGMANPDRPNLRKFHLNAFHFIIYEPMPSQIIIHAIFPYRSNKPPFVSE